MGRERVRIKGGVLEMGGGTCIPNFAFSTSSSLLHFFASFPFCLFFFFFFFFFKSVHVRFTSVLDGWVACHDIA